MYGYLAGTWGPPELEHEPFSELEAAKPQDSPGVSKMSPSLGHEAACALGMLWQGDSGLLKAGEMEAFLNSSVGLSLLDSSLLSLLKDPVWNNPSQVLTKSLTEGF